MTLGVIMIKAIKLIKSSEVYNVNINFVMIIIFHIDYS